MRGPLAYVRTDTRLVVLAVVCGWLSGLFMGLWLGMNIERRALEDRGHEVRRS